ncbi:MULTISPECIES: Fe-S cluster assembly sulfur transfer protein SufU [Brevibacterium]|nr:MULTISPECIES: SUF system NifU family Fe-S cluster assembly protein [Brevibacterium]MCG7299635.1 SUF system NifU family Fe-S cluster assembly protein [Brevibacterium sp. ACRRH]
MNLDQLYQQVILDHSKERHGNVPFDEREALGKSHQVNPMCGDEITAEVVAGDDGALEVRWEGDGCSISMASASVACEIYDDEGREAFDRAEAEFHELMHSRGAVEADEDVLFDAAAFAGVSKFPARIKCALLAWIAIKDALSQAESSKEGGQHD